MVAGHRSIIRDYTTQRETFPQAGKVFYFQTPNNLTFLIIPPLVKPITSPLLFLVPAFAQGVLISIVNT